MHYDNIMAGCLVYTRYATHNLIEQGHKQVALISKIHKKYDCWCMDTIPAAVVLL